MSATSSSQYQTNPLKEDLELKSLLKDLEISVKSEKEFEKWRNSFLSRFIEFLDAHGTEKAEQSYWKFSDTMSSFVRVINKLNGYIKDGSLTEDKCSVKALQCLQELSRTISLVVDEVDQLIPGTIAMEKQAGFTKFHIGAVLVRDGFREYGRMSMCADALEQMEKTLKNVADKLVLLNMNSYLWKLNVFCDVMADLGLFNAMLKCREYVRADDDEEALLLTSSLYPSFDPDSSVTVLERSNPLLSYDEASEEAHEPTGNLERSLTLFNRSDPKLLKVPPNEGAVITPQNSSAPLIDAEKSISILDQSEHSLCIVPVSPSQEIVVFGAGKECDAAIPYPNLHTETSITVVDRSISLISDSSSHASHLQKGFLEREPAPYGSSSNVGKSEDKHNDSMKKREAAPYSHVFGQNVSGPSNGAFDKDALASTKDRSKPLIPPSEDMKKPVQRVRWNPIDYYRGKSKNNNPDMEKEKKTLKSNGPPVEEPKVENQREPAESETQEKKNILSFLQRKPKDVASRVSDSNDTVSKASSDASSSRKGPPKPQLVSEQPKEVKEKPGSNQMDESVENDSDKPPKRQRKWSLKDFYTGAKERISNNLPKKKEKKKKSPRQTKESTDGNQSAPANPSKRNDNVSANQEDANSNVEEDDVSESSTMVSDAEGVVVEQTRDLANQGSVSVIEDASESSTMVSDTEEKVPPLPSSKKREALPKKSAQKTSMPSESDTNVEPKPNRPKGAEQGSNKPQVQPPKKAMSSSKVDKKPSRDQESEAKEKPIVRSKSDSGLPPSDHKQRRTKKNDPVSKAPVATPKTEKPKASSLNNESLVNKESHELPIARSGSDVGLPPSDHEKNPHQKRSDSNVKGIAEKVNDSHTKRDGSVNDESLSREQPPVARTKSDSVLPSSDSKQRRPKKQDSATEVRSSKPVSRENAAAGTADKPVKKNKADSRNKNKDRRQPVEPEPDGPSSSGDSAVSICAVQPALRSSDESPMEALLRIQRQMELISKTNSVDMYVLPELAPYSYTEDTFAKYLPVDSKNQAMFEELDRIYQATARKLNSYVCYGTIGWSYENSDKLEDLEVPNLFLRQVVVDRLGNEIATYDKTYICDYGYSSESRFFVPGPCSVPTSFEVSSRDETSTFRFGMLIGSDIRYPNLSRLLTADKDHRVDCIVQPTASFRDCAFRTWSSFQETRAVENSIYWIGANYSGEDYGGTTIVQPFVDEDHESITLDCEEGYAIIQISRETLDNARSTFPFYARLLEEESAKNEHKLAAEDVASELTENLCLKEGESKNVSELSEVTTDDAVSKSNSLLAEQVAEKTASKLDGHVADDASESETVVSETDEKADENKHSHDRLKESEKENQSIASSQSNYEAEKSKVDSIAIPLCNTVREEKDRNDSIADLSVKASRVTKEKKVLTEEVRRKCFMWYTRLGQPSREQMKRRVLKMDSTCDITVEDVDALPWIAGGTMISATELNKLMLSD